MCISIVVVNGVGAGKAFHSEGFDYRLKTIFVKAMIYCDIQNNTV